MDALAAYKYSNNSNPPCPGFMGPDFMAMAERELSAFFNAVTQLFGSEQAKLSALVGFLVMVPRANFHYTSRHL
jgi:hypothetical protein